MEFVDRGKARQLTHRHVPQRTRESLVMIRALMKIKQGNAREMWRGYMPLEWELGERLSKDVTCKLGPEGASL